MCLLIIELSTKKVIRLAASSKRLFFYACFPRMSTYLSIYLFYLCLCCHFIGSTFKLRQDCHIPNAIVDSVVGVLDLIVWRYCLINKLTLWTYLNIGFLSILTIYKCWVALVESNTQPTHVPLWQIIPKSYMANTHVRLVLSVVTNPLTKRWH